MRLRLPLLAALLAALAAAVGTSASAASVGLSPVARLPFPERGYVVDLPAQVDASHLRVQVRENGTRVAHVYFAPVGSSGLRLGVVLALDASDSMRGEPFTAALAASRSFLADVSPNQTAGVLTFNDRISRVGQLRQAPQLATGTRLYDALDASLATLAKGRYSSSSVVVLSDGADVGSTTTLNQVVDRATRQHVRIFVVGLRSRSFDPGPLRQLASATGGSYAETTTPRTLASMFAAVRQQLAREYLVQYRSLARPGETVRAEVNVEGIGTATRTYVVPNPAGLAPYHPSAVAEFFRSPVSLVLLALVVAVLAASIVRWLLSPPRATVVQRVGAFSTVAGVAPPPGRDRPRRRLRGGGTREGGLGARVGGLRARVAYAFDVADITLGPGLFVGTTVALTVVAAVVLGSIAVPLALLAVLVPLAARSWVTGKVRHARDEFADQTPETLQLLASALRTGHSFAGAVGVVAETAGGSMRRELLRVVADERLGSPIEVPLREVAKRMASVDFEQVALVSELGRSAGGNSAEVLDTIVETVRERADVRRLAHTLTAQGRLSRIVLTVLPIGVALFLLATQPGLVRPMYTSTGGQTVLVLSALMVVAGSLWIKKIVEVEV